MEEKNIRQQFEDMTKKLIAQVMQESDLKAINPEMVREIKLCVKALTDNFL